MSALGEFGGSAAGESGAEFIGDGFACIGRVSCAVDEESRHLQLAEFFFVIISNK